jgi:hypothetical protein
MSPIFVLIRTVETEVVLSDDVRWPCRIELFQNIEDSLEFRCRVWQQELFRMTPTFPMDENNDPEHISDEHIFVERGVPGSELASVRSASFRADTPEAALQAVLDQLESWIDSV